MRKHCVSDTGQSEYLFELEPATGSGVFRYRYLGQDVSYQTTLIEVEGDTVTGDALFEDAALGETEGTTVNFSYNWQTDVFDDGFAKFECEALQDLTLLDLPDPADEQQ